MSSILMRMMTVPIIDSIDAHTTSENHGTAEDTGIGMIALMSRGEVGDRVSVGGMARTALLESFLILLPGSFISRAVPMLWLSSAKFCTYSSATCISAIIAIRLVVLNTNFIYFLVFV